MAKGTGSIELDGRPYKTFQNVKALTVEPSVSIGASVLFSVWLHPANEACGYRMVVRMPMAGGEPRDRAGPHRFARRSKSSDPYPQKAGRNRIRLGEGDVARQDSPLLDVVAWNGGDVTHKTLRYDVLRFRERHQ